MKCYRCGAKGTQTWNICADGNKKRWVCNSCDVALNTEDNQNMKNV